VYAYLPVYPFVHTNTMWTLMAYQTTMNTLWPDLDISSQKDLEISRRVLGQCLPRKFVKLHAKPFSI